VLNAVAALFAALPGSSIAVPTPPLWWLLACYALTFTVGEWIKAKRAAAVSERTGHFLRIATPALAALLIVPALLWLFVPRSEFIVLALRNCEAYIWRAPEGRATLYVKQSGLSRSHNADAVIAALRCRGINKLDQLVWLDSAGDSLLLTDYGRTPNGSDREFNQVETRHCKMRPQFETGTVVSALALDGEHTSRALQLPAPTETVIDLSGAEPVVKRYRPRGP
jgi:hypothetical protein